MITPSNPAQTELEKLRQQLTDEMVSGPNVVTFQRWPDEGISRMLEIFEPFLIAQVAAAYEAAAKMVLNSTDDGSDGIQRYTRHPLNMADAIRALAPHHERNVERLRDEGMLVACKLMCNACAAGHPIKNPGADFNLSVPMHDPEYACHAWKIRRELKRLADTPEKPL